MAVRGKTVGQIRTMAAGHAASVLDNFWGRAIVPVDPVIIARKMGLEVYASQLGNDTFGMLVGDAAGARIYWDSDQPSTRARFTIAHELGHYVERSFSPDADETPSLRFVDKRSDDTRGNSAEVYANHFAGALLMPADRLKQALAAADNDIFAVSLEFGVSTHALQYRRRFI